MKIRLKNLRENLPKEIAGVKIVKTLDYLTQKEYNLPKADVLSFELEDGSKLIIRPSGTEPLVKAYLTVCFDKQKNKERLDCLKGYLNGLFSNKN
jgi:phosphoglucomutase